MRELFYERNEDVIIIDDEDILIKNIATSTSQTMYWLHNSDLALYFYSDDRPYLAEYVNTISVLLQMPQGHELYNDFIPKANAALLNILKTGGTKTLLKYLKAVWENNILKQEV